MEKRCSECKQIKDSSLFYVDHRKKDGFQYKCKDCAREYNAKRYAENPNYSKTYCKNYWKTKHGKETRKNYRDRFPEKVYSHQTVYAALKSGKLIKQPCEVCGNPKTEAHHDSYEETNWLNVRWLCRVHHIEHHGNLKKSLKTA